MSRLNLINRTALPHYQTRPPERANEGGEEGPTNAIFEDGIARLG